ncbi:MAG: sulfotransferase [Fuerstiella sp.]|nr:sulfotransferase [Fuerstiella sp.]MCP4853076.1 sulfotransferase [Fuerstiella sp.]
MTVFITGSPRGGTTCLARVVNSLGVPVLHTPDLQTTLEWVGLGDMLRSDNWSVAVEIIRNEAPKGEYCIKSPGILGHLAGHLSEFGNPKILYVLRDPMAIHHSIIRHTSRVDPDALRLIMEEQDRAIHLLPTLACPFMVVSYERLVTRTELAVREIAEFLHVDFTAAAISEVVIGDRRYIKEN